MMKLRHARGIITLHSDGRRNGPELEPIRLRLREVQADGEGTSCVLEPATSPDGGGAVELSSGAWKTLNAFPGGDATYSAWRTAAGFTEKADSTFRRHRKEIEAAGLVEKGGSGKGAPYHLTELGHDYRHHSHETANGGNGADRHYSHTPPHPDRGGGGGGNGADTGQPA